MLKWRRMAMVAALAVFDRSRDRGGSHERSSASFSPPRWGSEDVAVMFLSFSGVVVRYSAGTFVIDPANLLMESDVAELKRQGLKAVLYTHGHGDHLDKATAKALADGTTPSS